MNFNDYIIDKEDFEFYLSLSEEERILFLYDLICIDIYGKGSSTKDTDNSTSAEDFQSIIKKFLQDFEERLSSIIESNIKKTSKANIIIVNNLAIINSNTKKHVKAAAYELLESGILLSRYQVKPSVEHIFKKQEYFEVYRIIGQTNRISMN